MKTTVLVTGANGYIGKYLGKQLSDSGYLPIGTVRDLQDKRTLYGYHSIIPTGSINGDTSWVEALAGVDCVVHLAGCAHKLGVKPRDLADQHKVINTDATANLAKQCICYGVKRFIFVSSIGVLGNDSLDGVITNNSPYNPKTTYAVSKMDAELALDALSESGMQIIILRPPLVYGPGAPGNFDRLLRLISGCRILPFGMFRCPRSMISLDNLCDLVRHCVHTPAPLTNKFVVSDDSDWTTEQLVHLISKLLKINIYNLQVPIFILSFLAGFIRRSDDIDKLAHPLVIDSADTRSILGWTPSQSPYLGLKKAVEYFDN